MGLHIVWIANFDFGGTSSEIITELVVNSFLNKQTRTGSTTFTINGKNTEYGSIEGTLVVAIIKNHHGGFTAQLHGELLQTRIRDDVFTR
ncbi:hypothetical protein MSP8886_04396 [Marinomonas spartinae]|uniref:Uncharacterized protein n=1 Tax=Marinomonas spartinae TaxID=1792290 RepID=A0A1A8TWY2_9GAMM|nr:hypothetical protein MSP8886_04396 [Marinomonas spartinae]